MTMRVTGLRVGTKSLTFGWHPDRQSFFLHIRDGLYPDLFSLFCGMEAGSTTLIFGNEHGEIPTYDAFEKLLLSLVPLTEQLRLAIEPLKTVQAQGASAGRQ